MEKIEATYINEKKLVWLSWVHLRTNTNFLQGNQWMHNSKGREKSMSCCYIFIHLKTLKFARDIGDKMMLRGITSAQHWLGKKHMVWIQSW